MSFFNHSKNSSKTSGSASSSIIDVNTSKSIPNPLNRLKNNLSWAESIGVDGDKIVVDEEEVIFDSDSVPQVRDLLDPNATTEKTIASMFVNIQQDTPMILLLRALEQYPKTEQIEAQRIILEENIEKLQKAKSELSAVTAIAKGVNSDAVKAYASTEAALKDALDSKSQFETELENRTESIKQLLANCESNEEESRISKAIAELYNFNFS
ncbi:MAG: hypothetical protein AAGF07_05280 [Patescibacteria group bacterium]